MRKNSKHLLNFDVLICPTFSFHFILIYRVLSIDQNTPNLLKHLIAYHVKYAPSDRTSMNLIELNCELNSLNKLKSLHVI